MVSREKSLTTRYTNQFVYENCHDRVHQHKNAIRKFYGSRKAEVGHNPYFLIFSIKAASNFKSLDASLVFPLFLFNVASIKTISISRRRTLRSTELFVSNHVAKSLGFGGLLMLSSSCSLDPKPKLSISTHSAFCSSARSTISLLICIK